MANRFVDDGPLWSPSDSLGSEKWVFLIPASKPDLGWKEREDIRLPIGTTILGRGRLLGITDRALTRNLCTARISRYGDCKVSWTPGKGSGKVGLKQPDGCVVVMRTVPEKVYTLRDDDWLELFGYRFTISVRDREFGTIPVLPDTWARPRITSRGMGNVERSVSCPGAFVRTSLSQPQASAWLEDSSDSIRTSFTTSMPEEAEEMDDVESIPKSESMEALVKAAGARYVEDFEDGSDEEEREAEDMDVFSER